MTKTVRAKFTCTKLVADATTHNVSFQAVTADGNSDNEAWSRYTPAGQLSLSITNPECFGFFMPGNEYFIDISLKPAKSDLPK